MAEGSDWLRILDIAGGVASVVGLAFTIYVLVVAKGAKKAAEDARQAALSTARKRNLIEELEYASRLIAQLGTLLNREEWIAVQMRAEEIAGICKSSMARWGDGLSDEGQNKVLTAGALVESISTKSSEYANQNPTAAQKSKLTATHLRVSGLIHAALGEAHRQEERDGNDAD